MKQLIPQSKIDEAAKGYNQKQNGKMSNSLDQFLTKRDFESGIQFALNEIQPLMVELLDWSSTNYTSMDGLHCKIGDNNVEKWIDSQQLLEEFIESKNKDSE